MTNTPYKGSIEPFKENRQGHSECCGMLEDHEIEAQARARAWVARWRRLSFVHRWVWATSGLLLFFSMPFGLSFSKPTPDKDTAAAVVDGAWCKSPDAVHVTREIIDIGATHLCVLRDAPNTPGGAPPATLGQAVTHYRQSRDLPSDVRWAWGLMMIAVSLAMGLMAASDVKPPPPSPKA